MVGFLKKLFGGGNGEGGLAVAREPEEVYKDIEIRAKPVKDNGQWRVGGTLTRHVDGGTETRRFLRADLVQSEAEAIQVSVAKARLIIDQNGPSLWIGDPDRPV